MNNRPQVTSQVPTPADLMREQASPLELCNVKEELDAISLLPISEQAEALDAVRKALVESLERAKI